MELMALTLQSPLLLVMVLLMVPWPGYVGGQQMSPKHDQVIQQPGPRYLPRSKRRPGQVAEQWSAVPHGEPRMQPGLESWIGHRSAMKVESPQLVEKPGSPYSLSSKGEFFRAPANPFDSSLFVARPIERTRVEIPQFHSYDLRPESPYRPHEFAIDDQEKSLEDLWLNLWKQSNNGVPDTLDSTIDPEDPNDRRPAQKNKLTRTVPHRWNEFVLNGFIKFMYGGDDIFDMSEFSWIPGQSSISPSMIDDMLSWYQPEGTEFAIPKSLNFVDPSVVLFQRQSQWELLDAFNDNSRQMHTVPLPIVKLIGDTLRPARVEVQPERLQPGEHSWHNLENTPGNPTEEGKGLHQVNRHSFDFRDYYDYDFSSGKELLKKDPVLLGKVVT